MQKIIFIFTIILLTHSYIIGEKYLYLSNWKFEQEFSGNSVVMDPVYSDAKYPGYKIVPEEKYHHLPYFPHLDSYCNLVRFTLYSDKEDYVLAITGAAAGPDYRFYLHQFDSAELISVNSGDVTNKLVESYDLFSSYYYNYYGYRVCTTNIRRFEKKTVTLFKGTPSGKEYTIYLGFERVWSICFYNLSTNNVSIKNLKFYYPYGSWR